MMDKTSYPRAGIVEKEFNCLNDFTRVNDFSIETYGLYQHLHNWDIARWTFNRFCVHGREELANDRPWEKSVRIWETENRKIVGVAHIEELGEYFFQVHPQYTCLEEKMLQWAIRNSNHDKILVFTLESDFQRKNLYETYQATKLYSTDPNRMLILKKEIQPISLPAPYKIINLDNQDSFACEKISHLYTRIWPTCTYIPNGATVASLTTSPIYRKELSFIALGPNDCFAAFCFVWFDADNQVGHFYPIGTDPDYLGINLNQALMETALCTLEDIGAEKAFIDGFYESDDEKLFHGLGFERLEKGECFEINCSEDY